MNSPCKECIVNTMCQIECSVFDSYIQDALLDFGVNVFPVFNTARAIREITSGNETHQIPQLMGKRMLWLQCKTIRLPEVDLNIEVTFDESANIKIKNKGNL